MPVPWGLVGPAFDYPTPYQAENRFLTLRGAVLLLLALALTVLVSFRPEPASGAAAALLGTDTQLGDPILWSLAAAVFAVLGVVNIVRAAGQKRLLLEPGQPASLTSEILREAQGESPGAAMLRRALVNGAGEPLAPEGPWASMLLRLAPDIGHLPRPLHRHAARRLSQLLLAVLMLVLLLPAWVLGTPVQAAVAALGLGAITVFVVGAGALAPERAPPGPRALALWGLLGLLWVAASLVGAGRLPGQSFLQWLVPLQLPWALAALLWGLLLVEGLTLLAVRAQVQPVVAGRIQAVDTPLNPDVEPEALFRELDLELHRHWAEGVPSRRHAWQPARFPGGEERGRFTARVLEESNPLLAAADRRREAGWPRSGPERWLWLLGGLALLWTLMGAALWLWNGWFQLRDASVYLTKAGIGLALVVAAGHALRATHLLWSRFEVDSTLLQLDLAGEWSRGPAGERPARGGAEPAQTVDLMSLQATVTLAQVRSVFYAGAEHRLGSRTLLRLQGDAEASAQWQRRLQQLADTVAQAQPAAAEKRRRAREASESAAALRAAALAASATVAPAAAAPRPARYCAVCGTAVLAGARFCQHCGSALPSG